MACRTQVERLNREVMTMDKVTEEIAAMQQEFFEQTSRRDATLGHVRDENDQLDMVGTSLGALLAPVPAPDPDPVLDPCAYP